jgi:NAD-dependent dihydropyrimidine dehydrogenase PreA subunit
LTISLTTTISRVLGCHNITDVTLERLSKALNSVPVVRHEIEEEKNEIESNEKGMKSKNMDDTCHSTCMQDVVKRTDRQTGQKQYISPRKEQI